MNTGFIFIGALALFLVIVFVIAPLFYRRKIQSIYYRHGSNEMIVLSNALSTSVTKRGIFERHRLYLNKVNIVTGEILFRTKIVSCTNKMLNGYSKIIGLNDTHAFIITSGNRLFIADLAQGVILHTDKQLRKAHDALKNLKVETLEYDDSIKSVVVFNNQGKALKLIPETLQLVAYGNWKGGVKSESLHRELDTYKLTYLNPNRNHESIAFAGHGIGNRKALFTVNNTGTKRKFVVYDVAGKDVDVRSLHDDFLHPFVIYSGLEKNELIGDNKFLVLHAGSEPCTPDNMIISMVQSNSKVLWSHNISQLLYEPKLNDNAVVFYEVMGASVVFFSFERNTSSNILSVSRVNISSGAIESAPVAIRF